MKSLFPRASLKRAPHTRTRKNSVPMTTDVLCPPSRSSSLGYRKTRPPPLQIIPELSENELDLDVLSPTHSPATARPTQFSSQQLQFDSSRLTLSAFSFSIDDALLIFGDDGPRSPALSASSSTTDGASSEDVPATPGTSDDEDGYDVLVPARRLRPQRISIRPLCITKGRSSEDDYIYYNCLGKKGELAIALPFTEIQPEVEAPMVVNEDTGHDFYTRELEDIISLSPVVPFHSSPARRDSLILDVGVLSVAIEVAEPKFRGRTRLSKPLPILPPASPPLSSFPSISSLVRTTAHTSVLRRKRNIPPLPSHPPPPPPVESRPLPRMAVPLDVEDCMFPEEDLNLDIPTRVSIVSKPVLDAEEDASIYSRPSFLYAPAANTQPLPPAIPETPLSGMYGEVTLPRSSTDSNAPRSSIDSTSSSSTTNTPISPFSFPHSPYIEGNESEVTERLRSRWSSSTLASLDVEPSRTGTLLSPFRNVFGSRTRRVPPQKTPPQTPPSKLPKNKHRSPKTPSPPSTPDRHIRQDSRSSTSSAGTSTSECEDRDGSPSRLKRKPIPMSMFLRT